MSTYGPGYVLCRRGNVWTHDGVPTWPISRIVLTGAVWIVLNGAIPLSRIVLIEGFRTSAWERATGDSSRSPVLSLLAGVVPARRCFTRSPVRSTASAALSASSSYSIPDGWQRQWRELVGGHVLPSGDLRLLKRKRSCLLEALKFRGSWWFYLGIVVCLGIFCLRTVACLMILLACKLVFVWTSVCWGVVTALKEFICKISTQIWLYFLADLKIWHTFA
jgi:hypothetical protein